MTLSIEFLEAHPTIEELSIDENFGVDEVDLEEDENPVINKPILPNLRRLSAPNDWIIPILTSYPDRMPPIEDLRGLCMPTDDQRQTILRLLKRMSNLRRIKLYESSIVQDLRSLSLVAPRLTWIELRPRSTSDGFGSLFELKDRRLSDKQLVRPLCPDNDPRLTSGIFSGLRLISWTPWPRFLICLHFTGYAYSARMTTNGTLEYRINLLNGVRS